MQVVRGILGEAERAVAREVKVDLCWCFGAGSYLKDDGDAVESLLLTGVGDVYGRGISPMLPEEPRMPRPALTCPSAETGSA